MYTDSRLCVKVCCVHTQSGHHGLGMHPVHKVARDATGEHANSWVWGGVENDMHFLDV